MVDELVLVVGNSVVVELVVVVDGNVLVELVVVVEGAVVVVTPMQSPVCGSQDAPGRQNATSTKSVVLAPSRSGILLADACDSPPV